ncbi:MAG: nitrilase-related carbon-nitrogen hydrolase [Elusimicrobiales bacterium]
MKIGLFQYRIRWEDKKANKTRILKLIDSSDLKGVDWIIFPEMTLSGFTNNIRISTLSEDDLNFFCSIAKKYHINISFGGVENKYNKFITLDRNGRRISEYSKINLFHISKEDKHYRRGKKSVTFDMEGFSVSPFICFDLRFPIIFWKVAPYTTLYIVVAAWPDSRISHWVSLLSARAIENQAYVIGVNSLGEDHEGNRYSGYSVCFSPNGDMIIDCQSREGPGIVDISADFVKEFRERFNVRKIKQTE